MNFSKHLVTKLLILSVISLTAPIIVHAGCLSLFNSYEIAFDLPEQTSEINNIAYSDKNKFSRPITLLPTSSQVMREYAIKNYRIKDVIAAPGHRILRNPRQVEGLRSYILKNTGGNFEHDKILLNIVTDENNLLQSIDLWNAHHRLVAYITAGYKTLSEIPAHNLEILVNGFRTNGEQWKHFLPSAGLNLDKLKNNYHEAAQGEGIRVGTVVVPGDLSNFRLSSRNTVGKLLLNTFRKNKPRIGIYFGTFDPVHQGHINVAKDALIRFNLDEVIMVTNANPVHKSNVTDFPHRLEMLKNRVLKEKNINVYIRDASVIIDRFGRNPFIERVGQMYATDHIFQIIGEDSYLNLLNKNELNNINRKLIVYPRNNSESQSIPVPDYLSSEILIASEYTNVLEISSTLIRQEVRNSTNKSVRGLDRDTYIYIKRFNLYSNDSATPK